MCRVAFARVQRVQTVEETLNEFKRTRLVRGTWADRGNGESDGWEESGTVTAHAVVFARLRRVWNVEETPNEFRRARLVSSMVGRHGELEVRRVGGQGDWDCAQHCVCEGPEGSES